MAGLTEEAACGVAVGAVEGVLAVLAGQKVAERSPIPQPTTIRVGIRRAEMRHERARQHDRIGEGAMKRANHDTYIGAIFLLFCGFAWWLVADLPTGAGFEKTIGPEFFPGLMTVVIAALSLGLIVRSLWRGVKNDESSLATGAIMLRIGLFVILMVAYILMYEPLGFLLSSAIALPSACSCLEKDDGHNYPVSGIHHSIIFYLSFTKIIMVPLPDIFILYLFFLRIRMSVFSNVTKEPDR